MSQTDISADRRAAEAVVRHHAQLGDALDRHTERLLAAVERADPADVQRSRQDLLAWLRDELVPHALAEEGALYPAAAARPGGALLVEGMLDEHRTITALIAELDAAASPVRAAAAARALTAVLATHLFKENDLVVPLLVESDGVSLTELLDGMHALLGAHDRSAADPSGDSDADGGCGCGGCGCGGQDAETATESEVLTIDSRVDVRDIPQKQRHAHVLAALDAVPSGGALVLIAPHAPRPLLAEVEARFAGQFDVDWLESGPTVWQIRLQRSHALV